jgi:predicted DNA-binding antitoxin AbrB/MazE fold protein
MSQTITARYENGAFFPLEKIFLPEHSTIKLVIPDLPFTKPRPSLKGILANKGIHITEEDIAEARRECWGNFPREDIV